MALANMSNGSRTPLKGLSVRNQMEADPIDSNFTSNQGHEPTGDTDHVEHELIPPTSRLSRLPTKVSSPTHICISSTPASAIPALQNTAFKSSRRDGQLSVNTTSLRSPAINTKSESYPPSLTQHDINHPIRRPWTSTQIYQSSTDLAAYHGIPQQLPPAPSTNSRLQLAATTSKSQSSAFATTLMQDYLNMLSSKPSENTTVSSPDMMTRTTFTELTAPVSSEVEALSQLGPMLSMKKITEVPLMMTHLSTVLAGFRDSSYMTSPMPCLEPDFGVSPDETPYDDFLTTPLFQYEDAIVTSPLLDYILPYSTDTDKLEDPSVPKAQIDLSAESLQVISPLSPALESFDNPRILPSASNTYSGPSSSASAPSTSRRVSKATGIRKGMNVDDLLDENAPTQPRKYVTPSATSRKEVPATFARKRDRSAAFGNEEDELDDAPLNENERELIEAKRRKNTEAARKSRKRKLLLYQNLEKAREEEKNLKEVWKERALMLLSTLREHGINYPDFPEDVQKYSHI